MNAYSKMHEGDLGTHEGRPIKTCKETEAFKVNAVYGSYALLRAIERAGVRP